MASIILYDGATRYAGVRITVSEVRDTVNNRTTIQITNIEAVCPYINAWGWVSGSITINGQTAAAMSSNSFAFNFDRAGWQPGNMSLVYNRNQFVINHNPDGTSPAITISTNLSFNTSKDTGILLIKTSTTFTVGTIPRVSALNAQPVTLGMPMQISLSRASSGFTDTLSWACGSHSGTIAEKSSSTEFSFTPPISLADSAPDSALADLTLTVTTYSGNTNIGSKSVTLSCPIPESVVPSLEVTLSDKQGLREQYGGYVQNQSQLRLQTTGHGVYGSTIVSTVVSCGGIGAEGNDVAYQLTNEGTVPIFVTVTDSRGRMASWEGSIQVLAYRAPEAVVTGLYRCNADGEPQNDGSFARLEFDGSYTTLGGHNTVSYILRRRVRGSEGWTETVIAGEFIQFAAGVDNSYECVVRARDDFLTRDTGIATLSAAFALLDFDREHKAAGILQRANTANTLSIGANTKHFGHRITDVGKPQALTDAATLDSVYPVGSIYMSVVTTSPETLFGGIWEQIQGRFLLASSAAYPAGATGGEETHTLTVEEMPSHKHDVRTGLRHSDGTSYSGEYVNTTLAAGSARMRYSNYCANTGGGQAHNNMPPYLSVNMWVRTA